MAVFHGCFTATVAYGANYSSAISRATYWARRAELRSPAVIADAVVDDALSPDFPLGDSLEVFIRREDAERFIEEVRCDDPEVAAKLRIEVRELEAGGLN
jgi:hypothetical protein